MKKYNMKCPYCGTKAILRPANFIHGKNESSYGKHLYVCANWPACDAYVAVHHASKQPMGTLANGDLRHKRLVAHRELNAFRKISGMSKWAVYVWLAAKLGLTSEEAHIGLFTEDMCDWTIRLLRQEKKRAEKNRLTRMHAR